LVKPDEVKEYIGILKAYLNILVAIILTVGAGISKLYLSSNTDLLFWIGLILIIMLFGMFITIARKIHINIKKIGGL